MEQQAQFEGWAVVELFGHQKEVGYLTTQYFGGAAMFQIDVPELAEREVTTKEPQYVDGRWIPSGAVVMKESVPARSRMVGPGAIYSLNPCTEEFAREILDHNSRAMAVISLPELKQLDRLPDKEEAKPEFDPFDDDHDSSTGE